MKKFPIKSFKNIYITELGQVYLAYGKSDRLIEPYLQGARLFVNIDGKQQEVIYLMMEAFGITISATDSLKFKISRKTKTLSLSSIKITKVVDRSFYSSDDEFKMAEYKCTKKASHANARFLDKISGIEILQVIKNQKYLCLYCNKQLDKNTWQIDHFYSKYNGGRNVFGNIVACCEKCNRMKHTLDGPHFIKRCMKIARMTKQLLFKEKAPPSSAGVPFTKEP